MLTTDMTAVPQPSLDPDPTTGQLHFFEFAPEIRNLIYHHLFQGKEISVQDSDFKVIYQDGKRRHISIFERERSYGLNVLFASKRVYAEAKPVLMDTAIFRLDAWTLHRSGRDTVFRASSMKLVRSLVVGSWPYALLRYRICAMTKLSNVVLDHERTGRTFWKKRLAEMMAAYTPKDAKNFPGLSQLQFEWTCHFRTMFNLFSQNATSRAEKHPMKFTIKWRVRYIDAVEIDDPNEGKICFEMVSETAWIEEEGVVVSPKVDMKGLVTLLDGQTVRQVRELML